jgi:hypothetical protein
MSYRKIKESNFQPTQRNRAKLPVYHDLYNEMLGDSDNELLADTISEKTAGNGVAIDGVTLKDGAVAAKMTAESPTAANVLTAAESGSVFFLNSATGFASTLPAPAAGLTFKFVVSTQPTSGNHTVVTNGGSNVIEGMADVNSTLVLAANEDSINFVASTAIVGDWVEVVSDGTSWFVTGQSGATGGITFTAT